MKQAISFYINDESEIIGFCGSIVVKTDDDTSYSCFNFNEEQLKHDNTYHIGPDGKGTAIGKDRECALEVRKHIYGRPFEFEEWCKCTNCGYEHAYMFMPRDYCPRCGYKFTKTIDKGVVEHNLNEQLKEQIDGIKQRIYDQLSITPDLAKEILN